MKIRNVFFLLLLVHILLGSFQSFLYAQAQKKSLFVKHTNEAIRIDALLDEPIWSEAEIANDFQQFFPTDSLKSTTQTEVKLLYNDTFLYVSIKSKSTSNKFVINSLRRDFAGPINDNATVVFDTFNDGTNAFLFGVSPFGVQREIIVSNGGTTMSDFNANWDVKWQSEAKIYEDYYIIELAIPFSSLKYKEGDQSWGFQTYKFDLQTKEQSVWSPVPQNQLLANLAFIGKINFEKPLQKNKTPLYIIPYLNTIVAKNYASNNTNIELAAGADAKIAIGNGLNLDITANPDFSNVEVDNIITNTTRFEISLPEKRQFFIENSDLFSNFGNTFNEAKPFFSRRIGLVKDKLGNTIENKIHGGVRLSGKIDNNWRLGFLNLQTAEDAQNEIVSNNNGMIALQRKVFSRSNIGAFFLNRQTIGDYSFQNSNDKYNRVMGLDYVLASKDSKWNGKAYVHKSMQHGDVSGNLSSQAMMVFNTRNYNIVTDFVYVDQDFRSDLGFIPRKNIFKSGNSFQRTFYPKQGKINKLSSRILNIMYFNPRIDFKKTDHLLWFNEDIEFKNQAKLGFKYSWQYIFLNVNFDPTRTTNGVPLPANSDYNFNQATVSFSTNNTKSFAFVGETTFGQFYNGKIASFTGTATYRIIPKTVFSLALNYDKIDLPKPYSKADIVLISPKFDFTFSKSIFLSTLIQYSNQRENLGINSRLQWRFAPLSDLFLVYNDSYYTREFEPVFRSINLKLSYWFAI
jgi:Domain of unknown function (DUF5916)/Carbohydrate family 9 binding domain-like